LNQIVQSAGEAGNYGNDGKDRGKRQQAGKISVYPVFSVNFVILFTFCERLKNWKPGIKNARL